MDDLVGKQVDNYRILRLLGHGGFGKVYLVEHVLSHQQFAMKIPFEQFLLDPKFRRRFLDTRQLHAKLSHLHVVEVYDFGEAGNLLYLVMPLLKEGTLEGLIKRLKLDDVERYLGQICAALDYVHDQGIVHLDLKPANLLVDDNGCLQLSDFDQAHLMVGYGMLQGGSSLNIGTPYYMAPEHIEGKPNQHSDLYALGVILYQMLTGQVPFDGKNPQEVKNKHLKALPPSLRKARPDLPIAFEQVLAKALAKNPEDRFQSAGELLVAFKAACASYRTQPYTGERKNMVPSFSLDSSLVQSAGLIALAAGGVYLASTQKIDKWLLALLLLAAFALLLAYEGAREN